MMVVNYLEVFGKKSHKTKGLSMKQWFHNFYLATRADMVTFITLAACVLFTMSLFFNPFIGVFDKITITVVCLLVLHLQGMGLEIQSHEYAGFHLLEINRSYAIITGLAYNSSHHKRYV